jgi:hypothetical protein
MKRTLGAVAAVLVLFFAASPAAFAQAHPSLFSARPDHGADVLPQANARGRTRTRDVSPNLSLLDQVRTALAKAPATPVEIDVPVFDDTTLEVSITRVQRTSRGTVEFLGTVNGVDFSSATLVLSHGLLAGSLHVGSRAYQVLAVGHGRYQVIEVDRTQVPDEGEDGSLQRPMIPKALQQAPIPDQLMTDDGSTIDVLVVYTPQARAGASPGNPADSGPILSQIDLGIAAANLAYSNSGVVQRLRLVHAEEVAYNDSGSMMTDLDHLTNTSGGVLVGPDGVMDNVQTLRDAYGADAVSLWVEAGGPTEGGLGWILDPVSAGFAPYAYNVVRRDQASSNQSFAHELGHNMGLRHDAFKDTTPTPFTYAHGYVDTAHQFRTVMAYTDACTAAGVSCVRIDGFSSPLFSFNGGTTGTASGADSAHALNNTRVTVANFRASVSSGGLIQARNATVNTNEGAGTVNIPVARLGGTLGAASVNWATGTGTAIDGTDYVSANGTLNWADGDGADKNIAITILQDSAADGPKTFPVTLSGAAGADLGADSASSNVVIADDEPDAFPAGCAAPSGWSTPLGANAGWGVTTSTSTEGSCSFKSNPLVAPPTTEPGCTVAPVTYHKAQSQFVGTFLAGSITFDARTSSEGAFDCLHFTIDGVQQDIGACPGSGTFGLTAAQNSVDSGWQSFSLPVSAGTHTLRFSYEMDCFSAGDNAAYVDKLVMPLDPASIPTLNFSQPAYSVIEGGVMASVQVTRSGPSTGAIGAAWTTSNGTAVAGTDFGTLGNPAQKTGTLSWASGDSAVKTITVGTSLSNVPVINNSNIEGTRDFTLTLSAPTGGAAIGAQSSATVGILDDDSTFDFDTATTSVGEGGPNIVLNVTRTGSLNSTAAVTYTTSNGAAIAGTDFGTSLSTVQPTGVLSFGPGISSRSITIGPVISSAPYIPVINDTAVEGPKAFNVNLSAPTGGGHLGTTITAAVTINSDDGGLAMHANAVSVAEAAGSIQVQVDRIGSAAGAASVNYSFTNGTAVNGTHFTGASGTLNWAAGDGSSKFIPVTIIDNAVVNANRGFTVMLSGAVGGTIGTPSSTSVTVVDDDNTLQFSAATASVNESAGVVNLTVTRLGGAANAAAVSWTAADATAQAGSDYGTLGNSTPPGGVLNWGAGDGASKTIAIPILQDTAIEGAETFTVTLASPSGTGAGLGAIATATVTIVDDDSGLSFNAPSYNVVESGPVVSVQVNRIGATTSAVGVTWTTSNGTATAGQDYGTLNNPAQRTGTLSWAVGDAAPKMIMVGPLATIPVINDTSVEPTENFTITLSAPTGGAALGPQPSTTVNILDDDSVFAFDAPTLQVTEGGSNATLNVTRSGSLNTAATVMFSTTAGTAAAGTRYTTTSGTLSFAAGETVKAITIGSTTAAAPHIAVVNDAIVQGPQTFAVNLSSPTGGGQLGSPASSTITINSDDRGIAMGATTRTVAENAGAIDVQVVRLGPPTGQVTVNYAFTNGTAINGTHYSASSGQLVWPDTDGTPKVIHVPVVDDSAVNANRTFTVTLSGATNATLGSPASTAVTIVDDDNTVQFGAATAAVTEGGSLNITVTRSGGTANPASVQWSTSNGTAIAGTDFGTSGVPAAVSGTLSWGAGDGAAKTVVVPIINDATPEGVRTFTVSLASPTGATIGTNATVSVTLNDNDGGFVFASPTYNVAENAGNVVLSVMRIGPATMAGSVGWTTVNGTALAGSDFGTSASGAQRSGTLTWAAGDATAKTITIPILNDAIAEGDETFTVTLQSPATGFALGNPKVATVTILDDDIPPESELAFSQPKYLVLESGGSALLTVNRNDIGGGFGRIASVNYATAPGAALATSDYTTRSGTLTWLAGDNSPKQIAVPIVNDSIAESPEAFKVNLSGVTPGTRIATPSATVLIVDDDEAFPPAGAFPAAWVTPGGATAGWSVSNDPGAFEGAFSLRSDAIGDNEFAQTALAASFSAGTVSFRVRVSSEQDFDVMRFYVDGLLQPAAQWSGTATTGWQLYSVPITAGVHTLTWSYEKDGSASMGQDAAWIDAVTLPAHTP